MTARAAGPCVIALGKTGRALFSDSAQSPFFYVNEMWSRAQRDNGKASCWKFKENGDEGSVSWRVRAG